MNTCWTNQSHSRAPWSWRSIHVSRRRERRVPWNLPVLFTARKMSVNLNRDGVMTTLLCSKALNLSLLLCISACKPPTVWFIVETAAGCRGNLAGFGGSFAAERGVSWIERSKSPPNGLWIELSLWRFRVLSWKSTIKTMKNINIKTGSARSILLLCMMNWDCRLFHLKRDRKCLWSREYYVSTRWTHPQLPSVMYSDLI